MGDIGDQFLPRIFGKETFFTSELSVQEVGENFFNWRFQSGALHHPHHPHHLHAGNSFNSRKLPLVKPDVLYHHTSPRHHPWSVKSMSTTAASGIKAWRIKTLP